MRQPDHPESGFPFPVEQRLVLPQLSVCRPELGSSHIPRLLPDGRSPLVVAGCGKPSHNCLLHALDALPSWRNLLNPWFPHRDPGPLRRLLHIQANGIRPDRGAALWRIRSRRRKPGCPWHHRGERRHEDGLQIDAGSFTHNSRCPLPHLRPHRHPAECCPASRGSSGCWSPDPRHVATNTRITSSRRWVNE